MIPTDVQLAAASTAFRLAGEPSRLKILVALDEAGSLNVGEICSTLGLRQSTVSHRLTAMRSVGFVSSEKVGLTRRYTLTEKGRLLMVAARALFESG